MIGFGSFSYGSSSSSSSSSSNLSPLAQPFTVDRSVPKSNLNPLVPFAEDPYSYSYPSTFDNWLQLQSPIYVHDSFSCPNSYSESDSIHAPIGSNDGYYGSQSISSFGSHIKRKTTSSIGSFPFDQQLSESIKTTLVEAMPYYRQYPSAAIHDDTSPVVLNDHACDMSSTSNPAPLDVTYQTGYTGSFSVGYTDQWSGFCDGLPSEQQGRRKGLDGNSFSSRNHTTGSVTELSFLKQGTPAAKGLTENCVDIAASKSSCGSRGTEWIDDSCLSLSKGTLAAEGLNAKCVDIAVSKSSSGSRGREWIDDSCLSLSKGSARVSPNFARPGVSGSTSMLQEPHFLKEPFPASVMETWSSLFSNGASYEGCFTQLDSCTTDPAVSYASVTSSTPTLVLGARASGTNASDLLTSPSRNVNSSRKPGNAFDNDTSVGRITSNVIQTKGKEAYGHTCVGRKDYEDVFSKHKPPVVDSIDLLKGKSELQSNHFKLSDACNMVSGGAATTDSMESSSEILDQFNPAVDSPCWKGVVSSRQSPFGVAELTSPYLPVKEFEGGNSSNLEVPRILAVNAGKSVAVSLQKEGGYSIPDKKAYGEDGLSSLPEGFSSVGNFPCVEDGLKDFVNAAPYHSKVNLENEILSFDGIQEPTQPRKGLSLPIYSNRISVLKPSQMKQISHWNNVTLAEPSTSEATAVNSGRVIKDPFPASSVPVEHSLSIYSNSVSVLKPSEVKQISHRNNITLAEPSTSEATAVNSGIVIKDPFPAASVPVELYKQFGGASDTETEYPVAKIDIQLLVNAMHNMSELLLSICFSDVEALKKQDHEVLRYVINNLDACLSKKVGLMRSLPHLQFPESSTCCLGKLTDQQKISGTCRPQVSGVEAVDVLSQHDLKGEMGPTVSSKQGNKLKDFVSMKDEIGIVIDNDMTQAIKKIMEENFSNKETHPQTILFKNLWLEAEAELCSTTYKERYARLKLEMEKCIRDQEKGKPIDTVGHLSPEVSRDSSIDDVLIPEMEGSAVPDKSVQESGTGIAGQGEDVEAFITNQAEDIEASVASKAEDIEASVMDRFHISVASKAEDIEASVMDRFHILKCRVNNYSSMNQGDLLSSTGIVAYAGKEEKMSSPCGSGIQNIRTKGAPIGDRSEDGCVTVTIGPDMQLDGTNCTETKIGLDSDVPEQQDKMKQFGVCISDGLINSLLPNRDGNRWGFGGFDSPSSDWEHVLKEELN